MLNFYANANVRSRDGLNSACWNEATKTAAYLLTVVLLCIYSFVDCEWNM